MYSQPCGLPFSPRQGQNIDPYWFATFYLVTVVMVKRPEGMATHPSCGCHGNRLFMLQAVGLLPQTDMLWTKKEAF